tara:strand:+ start:539 stop:724 length:186 start_codon:yes stop_codon:yes gene_type:complete
VTYLSIKEGDTVGAIIGDTLHRLKVKHTSGAQLHCEAIARPESRFVAVIDIDEITSWEQSA